MKNRNLIFLFLTSRILIENCCLAGKHADEAAKTDMRRRRNEQIQKEFNALIDKQIARFSKDSNERKENQQNQVDIREEICEEDCVENIIAKLPKIKIKEVTRKNIQNANVSSSSNAKEIEKFSTNLSKLTLSNTHTSQLDDQAMEVNPNIGSVDPRNVQMPVQMSMEVSNEHVNSANGQKLNSTDQNYVDQAHPMSEGTTDTNLISHKSDQIGPETSNSQQKRARQRKQSTNNIQRTEFITEIKGSFSFKPKASEEPIVKYIEKQSDQRTESVDQNIEVPKQTNFPLDLIKTSANSVISQKANQNTKVNAVQTHSMSERTSAKLKTVKSDRSSKKKFQVDPKIKKSDQIDQQTNTKIPRTRGFPKLKSLSEIYQSDSVTTSTKETNSTDQQSYERPKSHQNDKQSVLIVTKSHNHIDQSNFAGTIDQQMDEASDLSQMVQLVMDDLMSPQHEEGDTMSNDKPILMRKKDLRTDQSIYEESPSRKRARPKKEKIEEKRPNGKPKMVKENTQPKSTAETKSDSNKNSADANINGAVKKIRYNPKYPISKILAMYVYQKKNNLQRIYFVEWKEDNETHSCWVLTEDTEALELVAKFIEECSISSALDAFLGAPVMSHVAKLLQNNDEAKSVMQSMGKQPEEMAAEDDYFVFAKEATKGMKKRAIETIDEFVKFIRRKTSNA